MNKVYIWYIQLEDRLIEIRGYEPINEVLSGLGPCIYMGEL